MHAGLFAKNGTLLSGHKQAIGWDINRTVGIYDLDLPHVFVQLCE